MRRWCGGGAEAAQRRLWTVRRRRRVRVVRVRRRSNLRVEARAGSLERAQLRLAEGDHLHGRLEHVSSEQISKQASKVSHATHHLLTYLEHGRLDGGVERRVACERGRVVDLDQKGAQLVVEHHVEAEHLVEVGVRVGVRDAVAVEVRVGVGVGAGVGGRASRRTLAPRRQAKGGGGMRGCV